MKKWSILKPDEQKSAEIASRCDIDKLAVDVMVARGFDDMDSFAAFFTGDGLENPFALKDMQQAADTVTEAVDNYELICVYGDYDCDGVTSTAILYDYLISIGANAMYYIPERADGYGINSNAVKYLHGQGVKLIITVDNGISAIEEAEEIYSLGMKLVVTDHHQPGSSLPRAEAVVDPHREDCTSAFKHLAGCGVALKLCAALDGGDYSAVSDQYLDLCAIGTVADVVSLTGENRYIVRQGLKNFLTTDNYGLRALKKAAGCKENMRASDIAFTLAPRINAAGRFGSPITAVKTLLSEQEDADVYANMLVDLNAKRKETEALISKEIFEYINDHPEMLNERVLVLSGEGWAHGVIGIVAARVMEYYGKPVILISDEGGVARGSARSMSGFNIFRCFQFADDLLVKYGGHECAGGLTIDPANIERFKERVYEFASSFDVMPAITITADKLLSPSDINIDRIRGLSKLEPFGEGNTLPQFAIIGAFVRDIKSISNGKHSKIVINYGGAQAELVLFGTGPDALNVRVGGRADFIVTLDINEYNGREYPSIKIIDYRPSGFNQNAYFSAKDCYERYKRGETLESSFIKKVTPDRQELIEVFKAVQAAGSINADKLYYSFDPKVMNYCKLRICIDIFEELGLCTFRAGSGTVIMRPIKSRADLEASQILRRLRELA